MLRLRFPQKVVRFGLLFAEGRKVVFEVAKMRMRVTYHNGRANKQGVYSTKHNDRNFEIENASHIAPEQTENNAYWHIYQHQNPEMSFENAEEKFYREHFGDFLKTRNNRYLAQRQKKRVQSMTDYRKSQKSCPEETIMQIGNINQKISKEKMCRIFNAYIDWQNKQYPQLATLNCAYHGDEQGAGHIHIRQVWIAHDQDGREMVHQGQCLKEMGVERPNLVKKESRYNNAKMVFTKASREKIIEIARSFGVEIEDKAQDASKSGKDLLAWQVEQDRKKTEIALAELQKIKLEQEEKLAEITKTEVYLANITEETEKEKKRAGEIKALAEAENKRLADLRVADAERQRQHEVELQNLKEKADKEEMRAKKNKALADAEETRLVEIRAADAERQRQYEVEENARQQRLQELKKKETETQERLDAEEKKLKNFRTAADKRMDEIMDELEATIAKTDKAKKEVEEITKKKVKVAAEYNQLSVDVSQLKMNRDFLTEKNEGLLENQRQILEDNKKYDAELSEKYEEAKQAEQIISEAENAKRELKLLQIQIPARKRELTEIKADKEQSIQIIAKIAEPILAVSSGIDEGNQNKVWSAVKNLVRVFKDIVDDIPILKLFRDNQDLIKNEKFTEAYENSCEVEQDLSPMERGLKFLVSVVRVHGTNAQIVNNAIRTVADVEGKDTAFEVQLLNSVRNTDEYKNQQAINNLQNAKKRDGWRI